MEKDAFTDTRRYKVIIILLILLSIVSTIIYFHFNNKIKIEDKKYDELSQQFKKINDEYNNIKHKLDKINDTIDEYNNINESISLLKSQYFKIAKEFEVKVKSKKKDKKIAYITFDDGPYFNTYNVLEILDKYNVKATFFTVSVNGQYCFDNKNEDCFKLYKQYLEKGHTIANHTYTHAIFNGLYNSNDSFMDSLIRQEQQIKEKTGGYVPNILRFPGGITTAKAKGLDDSIIDKIKERGYGWVDWTANNGDGGSLNSKDEAWANFTSTINDDIEVILFHDYNRFTTQMLPEAIEYLKNNNYVILPLFYESDMINK